MAEDSGSVIAGGVVVEIVADLSGLRAAEKNVRSIIKDMGDTKATIRVNIDSSKIDSQLTGIQSRIQQGFGKSFQGINELAASSMKKAAEESASAFDKAAAKRNRLHYTGMQQTDREKSLFSAAQDLAIQADWEAAHGKQASPAGRAKARATAFRIVEKVEGEILDTLTEADVVGGGKGGGGKHGRGSWVKRNLFSTQGLEGAGIGGSATAAFAILEATKVAGELMEAFQTSGNSERFMRAMDPLGGRNDPRNDPLLRTAAGDLAQISGHQQALQSVEGIPVLGLLFKLGDAALGTTVRLNESEEEIKRYAEAHIRATEYLEKAPMAVAQFMGDRSRVAQLQGYAEMEPIAKTIREQLKKTGSADPALIEQFQAAQGMDLLRRDAADRMDAADADSLVFSRHAMRNQGKAIAARLGNNTDYAFDLEREAGFGRLRGRNEQQVAAINDPIKRRQARELADKEEENYQAETRFLHQERDRERNNRIAAAQDRSGIYRAVSGGGNRWEAEYQAWSMSEARRIQHISNKKEQAAEAQAYDAEAVSKRAEHKRDLAEASLSLTTTEIEAKERIGNEHLRASFTGQEQAILKNMRDVARATPELADQAKQTAIAQFDAMKHDLNRVEGGTDAAILGANMLLGDRYAAQKRIRERQNINADIDAAKENAKNMPTGAQADQSNKWLESMNNFLKMIADKLPSPAMAG